MTNRYTPTDLIRHGVFGVEHFGIVTVVWFDVPDRSENVLASGFDDDLRDAFRAATNGGARAVVIASTKPGSFCAGADVEEIDALPNVEAARTLSRTAQEAMEFVRAHPLPVVAAIDGTCLGGGLELALACDRRVAADTDDTEFGFPEVQLGLLPGAGGTFHLPELIGVTAALPLLVEGDTVGIERARSLGIVDDVTHRAILLDVALAAAGDLARGDDPTPAADPDRGVTDRVADLAVANTGVGRRFALDRARDRVEASSGRRMPAPLRLLDVVAVGLERGARAGLDAEARAFGDLVMTSQSANLRRMLLDRAALGREARARADRLDADTARVGVIGGGLMGAGIAEVSLTKAGCSVRLRDVDVDATRRALASVHDVLDIRHIDLPRQREILARVTTTTELTGLADVDVCIEAVVEDADVKRQVFAEVEPELASDAVLATNTSSIPLAQLGRELADRSRFVGMHYFSPVGRVPLLEVIRAAETSEHTLDVAVATGRQQAKTVVVVADGPGFYTSRILARYLDEAARIAESGTDPGAVDDALEAAGMAVGPFKLLDDVGIDVGHEISSVLHDGLGDRFEPSGALQRLVDDDRQGRKNRRGVYLYDDSGERTRDGEVDPDVLGLLRTADRQRIESRVSSTTDDEIVTRCLLAMSTEAVRCLDDGVIDSPRDGDVAAVMGLGFPPETGGPFSFIDARGTAEVGEICRRYAERFGTRWDPPSRLDGTLLRSHAQKEEAT